MHKLIKLIFLYLVFHYSITAFAHSDNVKNQSCNLSKNACSIIEVLSDCSAVDLDPNKVDSGTHFEYCSMDVLYLSLLKNTDLVEKYLYEIIESKEVLPFYKNSASNLFWCGDDELILRLFSKIPDLYKKGLVDDNFVSLVLFPYKATGAVFVRKDADPRLKKEFDEIKKLHIPKLNKSIDYWLEKPRERYRNQFCIKSK